MSKLTTESSPKAVIAAALKRYGTTDAIVQAVESKAHLLTEDQLTEALDFADEHIKRAEDKDSKALLRKLLKIAKAEREKRDRCNDGEDG